MELSKNKLYTHCSA